MHRDAGSERLQEGRLRRTLPSAWALDADLTVPPRATKADLLKAMDGHVLGRAELIGRYNRK